MHSVISRFSYKTEFKNFFYSFKSESSNKFKCKYDVFFKQPKFLERKHQKWLTSTAIQKKIIELFFRCFCTEKEKNIIWKLVRFSYKANDCRLTYFCKDWIPISWKDKFKTNITIYSKENFRVKRATQIFMNALLLKRKIVLTWILVCSEYFWHRENHSLQYFNGVLRTKAHNLKKIILIFSWSSCLTELRQKMHSRF